LAEELPDLVDFVLDADFFVPEEDLEEVLLVDFFFAAVVVSLFFAMRSDLLGDKYYRIAVRIMVTRPAPQQ